DVLEPVPSGLGGELGKVPPQGDLRTCEDHARPGPVAEVVVEHLSEAFHRLRRESVHGPFDHAVYAPEVASKVHCELDVLLVIEATHTSLPCRKETASAEAQPRRNLPGTEGTTHIS